MGNALQAGAGTSVLLFPEHYFPTHEYAGIHDDMHARALLLVQGEVKGAIVSLELPAVRPWELTDELRAYAARLLDVPYENMWMAMTHDLAAPHTPTSPEGCKLHMDVLKHAIKTAAEGALETLQPVSVACCEGQCNVNANRDVESVDGWWVGISDTGPSDKTLSLLRFDGEDGKPVAVLYSHATKSSVLEGAVMSDGKRYATGDLTGRAGTKAEEKLGCPVLFLMGAAGDQVPKKQAHYLELDEDRHFRRVNLAEEGFAILEKLSDELAEAICEISEKEEAPQNESVLRFGKIDFHADGQVSYGRELPEPPVRQFDYVKTPGEDIPVWYMQIGTTVVLGVKPEICTPTFDEIKKASPFACTMLGALVNGGQGYIATDLDYVRYTYPGLKTPFWQGTDRVFIR